MTPREVLIGVGANLERPQDAIHEAIDRLSSCARRTGGELLQQSALIQTRAVAHERQDDYWNAAVRMQVTLEPLKLLDQLQAIEREMGRERKQHWGSRIIDLDLLLDEETILFAPRLCVPHPWLSVRRFALAPCVEIAADWRHPILQRSLKALRADHQRSEIVVTTSQELLAGQPDPAPNPVMQSAKDFFQAESFQPDASHLKWGAEPESPADRTVARLGSDWKNVAAMVVIGELSDMYQQAECLQRLGEIGKPFVACRADGKLLAETVQFVDAGMRS